MRILFYVGHFPVLSQPFLLNQAIDMIARGHDVQIYAQKPDEEPAGESICVRMRDVRARVTYAPPVPRNVVERLRGAAAIIGAYGWRSPGSILESLNVFRYGRGAANFHLLHERLGRGAISGRYDVIHAHFGPHGQRALAMCDIGVVRGPLVTTFHGYDLNILPKMFGASMYRRLFARGDLFTVGSEFMRRRAGALGASNDRVVTLPQGINLADFAFKVRRHSAGAPLSVLTVARLTEVKGLRYAIEAVKIASAPMPNIKYTIVGSGPLKAGLVELARSLGVSELVQFVDGMSNDRLASYYREADVFLLPSVVSAAGEEEGQGLVLAEAQASGLPVVATRTGGIPESVVDGRSALLVQPNSSSAISEALVWLAQNPDRWGAMGRHGRALVERDFALNVLNDRLEAVYRQAGLLAGGHA